MMNNVEPQEAIGKGLVEVPVMTCIQEDKNFLPNEPGELTDITETKVEQWATDFKEQIVSLY